MSTAILVIEDETVLAKNIRTYLEREGFEVAVAASGEEGVKALDDFRPDVVLVDYALPGMDGLKVLRTLRERDPGIQAIMMTGQGNVEVAVAAMKAGAYDYLSKPLALSELKGLIDKAAGDERRAGQLNYYRGRDAAGAGLARLVGDSAPMQALKATITQLLEAESRLRAGEPPAVLITGETGTGKELVARALHFDGPRSAGPFVEINCAAIPSHLLEAELFGYERGAFTDARQRKLGLVETAHGGTLFLDEIGEIDAAVQVKLLKLLEDRRVRRVGGLRELPVDVRIVAATNRAIERMVQDGRFRADLFFRLRIVHLTIPPLRERGADVPLLARAFLDLHCRRYAREPLVLSAEAERLLREYPWPGNVRELRNAMEQTVLLVRGDVVLAEHLAFCRTPAPSADAPAAPESAPWQQRAAGQSLEEVERNLLTQALERTGWNVTRAAKLVGLSRDTLRYRIEKYGLAPR